MDKIQVAAPILEHEYEKLRTYTNVNDIGRKLMCIRKALDTKTLTGICTMDIDEYNFVFDS